jgi:DNA repair protein RecO (recombination protein O)
MQWSDQALVLGVRRHGEANVVLELMTKAHGRHLGLVYGGRSRQLRPVLQPGNTVEATWRARLDEHLGTYRIEPGALRSARLMAAPLALYGLGTLVSLLRVLPERDPHPALFEAATLLVEHLDEPELAPALFVRFELGMLAELGFGLDLASCAVTGGADDLIYVSPKSGRAVSAAAGEPYGPKLLRLPAFLRGEALAGPPSPEEIKAGFALTHHFLQHRLFEPRGLAVPEERARFVAAATRHDG